MQLSYIGYTPTPNTIFIPYLSTINHSQPLTKPAYLAVYHSLSISYLNVPKTITSIGYGRKLSNLAKIYINNAKHIGCNNSFTFKLAIFDDICSKADVLPETKIKVFLIILKGLVLNYYYSNISISAITLNFDQVCNSIKNYFEGVEYKQSIFLK